VDGPFCIRGQEELVSVYVQGVIWVLGAGILAGLLAYLVRRIGASEGVIENNEAAGQVFTIVGGLQAVLVAFVLIALFDSVSAAEDGSYAEAEAMVATTWAADALPAPVGDQVRVQARQYLTTVAAEEWPAMRASQAPGDAGWAQLDQLRRTIDAAKADDDWANDRKSEAANQLWQVYQARQGRLTAAQSPGVSTVVWFALIAGSFMTVALPLMFGGPRPLTHILIVSILAGTLALLLFATAQLQNPFSGGARVEPAAFEAAAVRLR
jgi:hypothetical protein